MVHLVEPFVVSSWMVFDFWWSSDVLVEHAVDGLSVAEIFKLYDEDFFRDNEVVFPFSF